LTVGRSVSDSMIMRDPDQVLVEKLAFAFARALVDGEFEAARALLSDPLRELWTAARLAQEFTEMLAYGDRPADHVEVVRFDDMEGWAIRQTWDLGWAYVAIYGDGFNEAVTVIVGDQAGRPVIRDLEWGRP
jgi:hypothetical protein